MNRWLNLSPILGIYLGHLGHLGHLMNLFSGTRLVTAPCCLSVGKPTQALTGIAALPAYSTATADGIGAVDDQSMKRAVRMCLPCPRNRHFRLSKSNKLKNIYMNKIRFLSLLSISLLTTSSLPSSQAAPICKPVIKTTSAGTFTGNLCFDPATGSIELSGTAV